MLAADGRCKTLDAAADGYVRGEGVLTALLHSVRSVEEAASSGWQLLIRGSAVNQGGRSSTLTAPNGPSQQDVLRNALRDAGAAPADIAALQMHGTGTPLGDPIEVGAAAAVLMEGAVQRACVQQQRAPLALMASKSWVGHGEPAAGMAGIAHAALALAGACVLGISHLREVNPYVTNSMRVPGEDGGGARRGGVAAARYDVNCLPDHPHAHAGAPHSRWVLPRVTFALPHPGQGGELLSGVSAFAFQGTNAHAVLQRAPSPTVSGALSASRLATGLWERQTQWVAPEAHVMLHNMRSSSGRNPTLALDCQLAATPRLAFFWDHRVSGRALFPGAGFFELALAAVKVVAGRARSSAALTAITIPAPMHLPDALSAQGAKPVVLRCTMQTASGAVEITSSTAGAKQPHISAAAAAVHSVAAPAASMQPAANSVLHGLLVGAAGLESPARSHPLFALVDNSGRCTTMHVHPAALDSCLQLAAAASGASELKVPAALQALHTKHRLAAPCLSAASRQLAPAAANQPAVVDYWLAQADAGPGLGVQQLTMKPLGPAPGASSAARTAGAAAAAEEPMYELGWVPEGPCAAAELLQTPPSAPAVLQLRASVSDSGVCLTGSAIAALQQASLEALGGAQLLVPASLPCAAPTGAGSVHQAGALAGLLRTVALEHPQQQFGTLHVDLQATECTSAPRLALIQPGTQLAADVYGLAVRDGKAMRAVLSQSKRRAAQPAFHLMPQPRGGLGNLKPLPVPIDTVAPGQVLIAVRAVGVNFRDLLNVLGMYPGDPGPPGADSAGVVLSVGRGVEGLQPGDAVFGLAAGSIGSHVHTPAATVVRMPPNLSFEEAATTPTVFITVDEAFRQAAAVAPGDRVLVHAAAGGVGLAALQLIHALGAQPMATAGSSDKRMLVRSRGVCQVLGSRDTAFAGEAAQLGGVDVVLNSLTSAGMVAGSLAALRRGGRMVEISKRDIWSAARVAQGERRCVVSASLVLGPP